MTLLPTPAGRALAQQGAANVYRDQEILSASPAQLILILYDHALTTLARGQTLVAEGKPRLASTQFGLCAATLLELRGSLDMAEGGEIAEKLAHLYAFWSQQILGFQERLDPIAATRIAGQIRDVRDSWAAAMEKLRAEGVQAGILPENPAPAGQEPGGSTSLTITG